MPFSSISFIFYFLPVFLLGYYLAGWRTGALLAGSVAFYVWGEGVYILLLLGLIGLNYAGTLAIDRGPGPLRTPLLAGMITFDLLVLGLFKYTGFVVHNLNAVWPRLTLAAPRLALPLGISFFTFQLISYAADVRRGTVPAERNPLRFAAYILMFPHLIAGPIVRYADIRAEMHGQRQRTTRVGLGLQYFIVGLCQKVMVADGLAPLADHAFSQPAGGLDGLTAWAGIIAYSLQIYFDFCGYSNMAIGLAFLLGFTFPRNFNYPYASRSITEFWRRWHMSLSSWFRDYVFIPLGGSRGGRARTVRNVVIVFLLTGVWHGAAWQFVFWGLFHGSFLLLERSGFGRALKMAPRPLQHAYALLAVMVGWVFFRAADLPHALAYLHAMADPQGFRSPGVDLRIVANPELLVKLIFGVVLAFPTLPLLLVRWGSALAAAPHEQSSGLDTLGVRTLPTPLLVVGMVLSLALLVSSTLHPFLYFRF